MKSGYVALVGRPNAGKSTLLNNIIGEQISISSELPQTTQQQLLGIHTTEKGQIVFVDTPGIHITEKKFGTIINSAALKTLDDKDVDLIIYLVDVSRIVGEEEDLIYQKIINLKKPYLIVFNKTDIQPNNSNDYIRHFENRPFLNISALNGDNISDLINQIYELLPEGVPFFDEDLITDKSMRFLTEQIIRKQLIINLKDEIPHACAVKLQEFKEEENNTKISAYIYVENQSQKKIVIGKDATKLKQMKHFAKRELKRFIDTPIQLDLHIKVKPKWRKDHSFLSTMGFETK